jgi:hypothetical protein
VKDVNNVHLVCRNLHQIANLHVNPKLCFKSELPERDLKSLVQSSRIFEELEFLAEWSFLWYQEKFELIEEYLGFIGSYIKTLKFSRVRVEQIIFQSLLDLLPNLTSVELEDADRKVSDEDIEWFFNSSKIERIKMSEVCYGYESLFESLDNCLIKEANFGHWSGRRCEVIYKFLMGQENNLKKLTVWNCEFHFLRLLTDLRLEHLDFGFTSGSHQIAFEFLKQQADLKFLRLTFENFSEALLNIIWELKNLEVLELNGRINDSSCLNNLHKLGKLKGLDISSGLSSNILNHLKFGVFNDLEELAASFEGGSVDSVREMKQFTPKLKKIVIYSDASNKINSLLETLENLESVKIKVSHWVMNGKVHPKIKHLDVDCVRECRFNTVYFSRKFPKLEYLKVMNFVTDVTESSMLDMLLLNSKLKTLTMHIRCDLDINPESIMLWFRHYGRRLEVADIVFSFPKTSGFALQKRRGGSFCINK